MEYIFLLILIFLIIFILLFEPLLFKNNVKNNNEHGSARFARKSEIKRTFKKEKISNIKEVGVPILFDKKLRHVWFDTITPHWIYLGATGSGKSVTSVIPQCSFIATSQEQKSVFITDPKGEVFNSTSKMFKDNGYKIITINFRNPELSNHINILEPVIKEWEKYIFYVEEIKKIENKKNIQDLHNKAMKHYAETNKLITSIASLIMIDKTYNQDPFWNNSAKNLLEGLISFFLEEYKDGNIRREQITMTSIRKFQNSSLDESNFIRLKSYINKKPYGTKSKDSLTSIFTASDATYKSITSTFGEKMSLFDDINVSNVTSYSDFDFEDIGKEKIALYLIIPDEDKTYYSLVSTIIGILYKELVKLADNTDNKKLPVPIEFILDEFANCPPLNDIESLVAVSRSRGMKFHFYIQSFSQLNNIYGKEVAQIILDNCGLIYLKTNNQETAEIISKKLGKKTIEANSVSNTLSLINNRGNRTTSLIGRELMTPDEIKQLHYKTIIFSTIGYPVIRDTILFNKFSCYISGKINLIPHRIYNLSDNYFVVEDIFKKKEHDEIKEQNDFLKEKEIFDKEFLKEAIDIVNKIVKDNVVVEYRQECFNTIACIQFNKKLTNKEKIFIKNKLKKNYELIISDDINTSIEIHIKNILEKNMSN